MADQKEYLSKEKYVELEKELDHLKKVVRREVAENLEYAKGLGDLSENAEYQEARANQASTEERIAKLENILKNAEIMTIHHSNVISIGSTVHVKKEGDSKNRIYQIVGSEESDMATGKISLRSPMGQALQGKEKGDTFVLNTPAGKVNYTILEIE
ncbi:MAG: transcription elongation factor GreA [bacterium]